MICARLSVTIVESYWVVIPVMIPPTRGVMSSHVFKREYMMDHRKFLVPIC
ncbi:hypothetical protein LINPERPRIM_LOCUS15023 [Linum perenne]